MPQVGDTYRVSYIARDFKEGLTDVKAVVYKTDLTKQGVYNLTEVNLGDGKGVYSFEYEDSDVNMPGTYTFVINSASNPKKDAKGVYFEPLSPDRPVVRFS